MALILPWQQSCPGLVGTTEKPGLGAGGDETKTQGSRGPEGRRENQDMAQGDRLLSPALCGHMKGRGWRGDREGEAPGVFSQHIGWKRSLSKTPLSLYSWFLPHPNPMVTALPGTQQVALNACWWQ